MIFNGVLVIVCTYMSHLFIYFFFLLRIFLAAFRKSFSLVRLFDRNTKEYFSLNITKTRKEKQKTWAANPMGIWTEVTKIAQMFAIFSMIHILIQRDTRKRAYHLWHCNIITHTETLCCRRFYTSSVKINGKTTTAYARISLKLKSSTRCPLYIVQ